jgi:hypothetical protein
MWSSWVKRKGTTQVMYIAMLKDGPNRVKKTFSIILERFLKRYDWGVENEITSKMIFEVEVFFFSQNIDFPFIWRDSWSFFFFLFSFFFLFFFFCFLFFQYFFSFCSVSWGLGGFDDIWGENHFFKNFFSNGMVVIMDILAVDAYSGMELCTPI